jgi:hypothetical protein
MLAIFKLRKRQINVPAGFLLEKHHSSWIQGGSSNIQILSRNETIFFKYSNIFFLNTQETSINQTGHYKSVKFPTHLGNRLNFGSV